jgi:hypothetical protein
MLAVGLGAVKEAPSETEKEGQLEIALPTRAAMVRRKWLVLDLVSKKDNPEEPELCAGLIQFQTQ